MGRVSWSDQAEDDLAVVDPAVIDQLKRNAEEILHDIPPIRDPANEGADGGIMWCRGISREQELQMKAEELGDGPPVWDYFLFYRKREPGQGFEVLAVRSVHHIASMYLQMTRELPHDDADMTG